MKESAIVRQCLDYLELRGILAWRTNNAGVYNPKSGGYFFHGTKGVPDITAILPNGMYFGIEVKGPKGRMSPEQKEMHRRIVETNAFACCVRSVEELAEDLKEVTDALEPKTDL